MHEWVFKKEILLVVPMHAFELYVLTTSLFICLLELIFPFFCGQDVQTQAILVIKLLVQSNP